MSAVRTALLEPLIAVFGLPKTDQPEAYIAEFVAALERYPAADLAAAKAILLRRHRYWPRIAECIDALAEVSEAAARAAASSPRPHAHPEWTTEKIMLANRLIRSDLGRTAVAGDWISPLWDFARREGRLPQERECGPLVALGRQTREVIAGCNPASTAAALCHGWERRIAKLTAIAMGERAP